MQQKNRRIRSWNEALVYLQRDERDESEKVKMQEAVGASQKQKRGGLVFALN